MHSPQLIAEHRCFGGLQRRYRLASEALGSEATVGVFLPPQALEGRSVPTLYWLSGLTCSDETFVQKAGAQRPAADLGLAIVTPDTSPRGDGVPDDPEGAWDFGHGAGFYVDAERLPWARHYRMHSHVVEELPARLEAVLPLDPERRSVSGHSMGGHGALVCALRHPGRYRSVSAFAPIGHPGACPWGRKALGLLLGEDPAARRRWRAWDATALLEDGHRFPAGADGRPRPVLIDQGDADGFLEEQLRPADLERAARRASQPLQLRHRRGYDHSYFFVASFIESHLRHHARALAAPRP
jgi:S-formylglutathione hydrolase